MSEPHIEWLCMADNEVDKSSKEFQTLMGYLLDNPFSTVVDLDEGEFEIARYATLVQNQEDLQNTKIVYVEIDNRNELFTNAIQSTPSYEMFFNMVDSFTDCNCYKRTITISETENLIFSEVT